MGLVEAGSSGDVKGKGKAKMIERAVSQTEEEQVLAMLDSDEDDSLQEQTIGGTSNTAVAKIPSINPTSTTTTVLTIRPAPTHDKIDLSSTQLIIPNSLPSTSVLPDPSAPPHPPQLLELPLPASHHLARALNEAGLPETALMNREGVLVPVREVASGSGEGLGRGEEERMRRERREREVMGEEKDGRERVVPTWGYRARNAFMFGPDADNDPLKRPPNPIPTSTDLRQHPPEITHAATRLSEEDELEVAGPGGSGRSSTRAGSPTRSRVAAAIGNTPYRPQSSMPTFNNHALVPAVPSPSPEQLGPQGIAQLMTWGSLLATPRALDESNDPLDSFASSPTVAPTSHPNPFNIKEAQRRDQLGRKLATDAARAMRERARGYGTAPRGLAVLSGGHPSATPGSSSRRSRLGDMGPPGTPGSGGITPSRRNVEGLTPAGRTLLERSMGTPLSRSRQSGGGSGGSGAGGSRSRSEAMDKTGGWANLGGSRRKDTSSRTWTPSPAVRRG